MLIVPFRRFLRSFVSKSTIVICSKRYLLVPSQNFENERTDGRALRDYLQQEVSKPADNFYVVKNRQQVKRTLELHADNIVDKLRDCFNN